MNEIKKLHVELEAAVAAAGDLDALEQIRVAALGRKGTITQGMKGLGDADPETRKTLGQALNQAKDAVAGAIEARRAALEDEGLDARLAGEAIDITLPVRDRPQGRLHPISRTLDECIAIFGEMGFTVAEGPDIEDDFHNFAALNIPPEHPARQMHDTFYFPAAGGAEGGGERLLLRTHTSPVQIRTMEESAPPIRIIAPGRTYRCDSDATHTPMFHQIEALVVDETTHLGHLKGCIIDFVRAFFDIPDLGVRFRPSYFPFTEPSMEVDIACNRSDGEMALGHEGGTGDDWLEIIGSGMVHPNVLSAGGIDPDRYQGFAFGLGVDRIAMLKYGIPDLRTFFEADLRWLKHYGFVPLETPSMVRGL
ncbi:MAG: phenylalanine--tRNA ligase subunit alpha [Alphaproteobacteria bacterium]|nr:phenylalanine--tRNA ligase subunit alpha [Alphaproteobacteria bacterium]